ncbi:MAG: o-succinylbenzoate synthase [Dehalococcoidia bacterium]|nr:MAG: o-succinylbenzoate synthase [Dehalococcoidia bacterium]
MGRASTRRSAPRHGCTSSSASCWRSASRSNVSPMTTAFPHPVALRWRPFRLPLRARFEAAHGQTTFRDGVLIEARDAVGRTGIGEASPYPSLGGGTVDDVLGLLSRLRLGVFEDGTLTEGAGVGALRCAVDAAILDLAGRAAGKPVAALLSDAPATSVAANAVIGGGTPDEVVGYALDAVRAGYTVLKLKVGVAPLTEEVARIEAVRRACSDAAVRLDANGAWDEATARAAIEAFAPLRIEWLEQPVPPRDIEGLARLHAASPIRIGADESLTDPFLRERVLNERAASVVVLKPMMLGGIRVALDFARRAIDAGMTVVVTTTFDSSIGTAVALHLAAALGVAPATEVTHGLSTGEHLAADLTSKSLVPTRGRLGVSSAPGLDIEVDAAALDAVATAPWSDWERR